MSITKHIITFTAASLLAIGSLAGCDDNKSSDEKPEAAPKTSEPREAPAPRPAPEPAEPSGSGVDVKIGISGGTDKEPKAGVSVDAELEGTVKSK